MGVFTIPEIETYLTSPHSSFLVSASGAPAPCIPAPLFIDNTGSGFIHGFEESASVPPPTSRCLGSSSFSPSDPRNFHSPQLSHTYQDIKLQRERSAQSQNPQSQPPFRRGLSNTPC